ncbi:hypothetical protein [Kitasatospora aureofaciens]|uniref:hypothetical protein n=1 Tax=Kitasatospora aureofaciens TaxID=1894 RepID=UPI0033C94336
MSFPEFDFGKLENEIQSDNMNEYLNSARNSVRLACQLTVAIEADAIEAGLPKDIARTLAIAYLEYMTGVTVSVKR